MDAAIASALAACERSFARAAADLRHLRALVAGDAEAVDSRPEPAAAAAAPVHKRGSKVTPVYTHCGKPVFIADLARMAGCSRGAMEQRLYRGMTTEQAVAAGARMSWGAGRTAGWLQPAAATPAPTSPTPAPTPTPAATTAPIAAERPPADPRRMYPRAQTAPAAPRSFAPTPAPTEPPAAVDPAPAPSPYGFSVFNPIPVPQRLVNTKPGYPPDLLPGQRRRA